MRTFQDNAFTVGATLQPNLFRPCEIAACKKGPAELNSCDGVSYGKTVWYDFYPDHNGQVEIRTIGIPNVISLYTFEPKTFLPQFVRCARGSAYATNDLFANVLAGVDYTYQIGGRDSGNGPAGGELKMLFNYAYRSHLTVAPFLTRPVVKTIPGQPRQIKLLALQVIGVTQGEHVSAACISCGGAMFHAGPTQGNVTVVHPNTPPTIGSATRVIVGATSSAQLGRFKIYGVDPTPLSMPPIRQGCLEPGVSAVSPTAIDDPSVLTVETCPLTLLNQAGAEYVFWRGEDGHLWEKWYAGGSWTHSTRLLPSGLASSPAVAVRADGEQDVFWKGLGGNLWEASYTGTWNSPVDLGAGQLGSKPSVGVDAAGDEFVFWQGRDRGLWEMRNPGSGSQPVELHITGKLGSPPAVAVHADGEQDVFWKGLDGNLWEATSTGKWQPAVNRGGGQLGSGPSVVSRESHAVHR
jgi:hypothetical protein